MLNRTSRPGRVVAACCMVVAATLCAACQSATPPRFEHAAARVTDRTPEGVAMNFTLDAYNENDIALPLRDVTYSVLIDGEEVFRGTRSAEATLRRRGVQQIRLPAVIALDPGEPVPTGTREYRLRGSVTYVTPGKIAELLFDTGVRVPTASFETEGEIDLGAPTPTATAPAPVPARGA